MSSLTSFQRTAIRRLFQQAFAYSKQEESKYGPIAIERWKEIDIPRFISVLLTRKGLLDEDEIQEHYNDILKIFLTTLKRSFGQSFVDSLVWKV